MISFTLQNEIISNSGYNRVTCYIQPIRDVHVHVKQRFAQVDPFIFAQLFNRHNVYSLYSRSNRLFDQSTHDGPMYSENVENFS